MYYNQRREQELYHFGVLGMKWGVRRYQNKDGSLTPAGKKHVDDYNKSKNLKKRINDEGNKLIRSNSRLKRDFGGENDLDDADYLEYIASDYGINTKSLRNAIVDSADFYKQNRKSIEIGRKIVQKISGKHQPDTSVYIDQTGSHEDYMRR